MADERGSVIAVTNTSGSVTDVNKYDAYGVPASGNDGLFQYTGQIWLDDVDLYHYKARTYDPELGRFLQTDPIGMAGGINLYAYAGNDAVSFSDPSGLCAGVTQIINRGAAIGYGDGGMEEVVATIRAECIEFDEFFPDDESLVNYVNELVRMATSAGATPGPQSQQQCVRPPDNRSFGEKAADSIVGFGDAFLIPVIVRKLAGIEGDIDYNSSAYGAGKVTGIVWGTVPIALEGAAAYSAAQAEKGMPSLIAKNRYFRIGPGRGWGGTEVPRISSPYLPGDGHFSLTTRLPLIPPLGIFVSASGSCSGGN